MSDEWNNSTPATPVPQGTLTPGVAEAVQDFKKARRKKAALVDGSKLDRLPPHDEPAEKAVLGCILLEPVKCLTECAARKVEPGHFYDLRHQMLFNAMMELHGADKPVDVITLQHAMKTLGNWEEVGGMGYVATLPEATPSGAHLDHYIEIVREKFVLRRLIANATNTVTMAYENKGTVDELLDEVQRATLLLTGDVTEQRAESLKQLMPEVIDDIEDGYHRGSAQIKGLTTGLGYLDKILCGFGGKHGNFLVIAARPGVGKSALAMQIAEHLALEHKWFTPQMDADGKPVIDPETTRPKWEAHLGVPVGMFSLEMSAEELLKRMLFRRSGVDAQRFKTGFASKEDFERLALAGKELNKAPIWIDDDDSLTIDALIARARLMVRQHGIKAFIVDYIQCLQVSQKRFRQDRVQEMAEISNGLRRLGKTLGVPLIVLAQMNRDFAKEKGVRVPRLEDLRDSGAIEQDAHVVMFLYEDDSGGEKAKEEFEAEVVQALGEHRKGDWSAMPRLMKLLVAKNRHGMSNKSARLVFDGSNTSFEDYYDWKKRHKLMEVAKGEPKQKGML